MLCFIQLHDLYQHVLTHCFIVFLKFFHVVLTLIFVFYRFQAFNISKEMLRKLVSKVKMW